MSLTEICRKYPKKMPEQKSVYRWRRTKEEFKERYDTAYQTLLYLRMQEMDDLSSSPVPSLQDVAEKHRLINSKGEYDFKAAKHQCDALAQQRRLRIDTLKFMTANMAPKMIPEMADKSKDINVNLQPTYLVQDYSAPAIDGEVETPKKLN